MRLPANKMSSYWMMRACGVLLYVPFIFTAMPRLCLSVFMFSQPFYLQRVVSFVGEEENEFSDEMRAILVGACAIIFLSVAVGCGIAHRSAEIGMLISNLDITGAVQPCQPSTCCFAARNSNIPTLQKGYRPSPHGSKAKCGNDSDEQRR